MNFSNLCGADYSYMLQFIHTLMDVFYCVYLFVFSSEYDFYFALFILIVAVQWVFNKNECSFSYLEKKWLDPSYVFGSDPKNIPHYETFHTPLTVSITHYMHLVNMFIIIWRTDSWLTRVVALLGVAIGYYQIYVVKYDDDTKKDENVDVEVESKVVDENIELVIDEDTDQALDPVYERPLDQTLDHERHVDEVFETIKSTF
jgi:hypothetical protein